MLKVCVGCLVALTVSACAGRVPQPSPIFLASDQQLECGAIEAEAKINNERIATLAVEQNWKFGQNVTAGIAGFMLWPAWLALDFQDAAGKEAKSLSLRNQYLLTLAEERCQPAMQTASVEPSAPTSPEKSALASNDEIASSLVSR